MTYACTITVKCVQLTEAVSLASLTAWQISPRGSYSEYRLFHMHKTTLVTRICLVLERKGLLASSFFAVLGLIYFLPATLVLPTLE